MALAVARPLALEGVIAPLGPKRLSGNEHQHHLRESAEVIPAGSFQPRPILEEC